MNCIIVRYAELSLKGKNRIFFEKKLIKNIKDCLDKHKHPYDRIERLRNRIIIHAEKECLFLSRVFGIASFSPAIRTNADLDSIKAAVLSFAAKFSPWTKFRVTTKRLDKSFPLTSMELDRKIGEFIMGQTNATVSLKNYDFDIGIEILSNQAHIFTDKIHGFGGLPLGISGVAVALIDDEKCLIAAWLMMKRGVFVHPISLKSSIDISLLQKYSYGYDISLHNITSLNEIESYIEQTKSKALVLGQTLETFSQIPVKKLTLRPLIGYDEKAIQDLYNKIK